MNQALANASTKRFTAISGIIGVILFAAGDALIADLPSISAPAHTMATYVASHQTQFLLFVFVWGATVAATLCFLTGLWSLLRHLEGAPDVLATLALGAGYIVWAIVLGGLAPALEFGYRSGQDEAVVKMLSDLAILGATLSAFPTIVSVVAFSLLIVRTGAFARWVGWFGFVVGFAHLLAAGAFAQDGFFSPSVVSVFVAPPLYFLWILILSVALLLGRSGKPSSGMK
ncbi:MAG TPA: hypothetical protein VFN11_06350 [Ktedonobacterales bacterium]|nr:hypothetical protein [Ktedonobacterales bacterium]